MHNVQLLADGTRRAAAGQVAMPHENGASFFGTRRWGGNEHETAGNI